MKVIVSPRAEAQIRKRREWWRQNTIRWYRMPKTRCHLYLEVIEASGEVHVLAAGGCQRRRSPRLHLHDAP